MQVIDMFEYSTTSYRRKLKALYEQLDQTNLTFADSREVRKEFFHRMRAEFICVAKLKRHTPIEEFLKCIKMSAETMHEIEAGIRPVSDRDFQLIVTFLGCSREHNIFCEKLEKALTPGLREARAGLEKTLIQYGIRFSDSELK